MHGDPEFHSKDSSAHEPLRQRHLERTKYEADVTKNIAEESEALYLRTGILEFDAEYQSKWEECIKREKVLATEISKLEEEAKHEYYLLQGFRKKYAIEGSNRYKEDIGLKLNRKYSYKKFEPQIITLLDKLHDVKIQVAQIRNPGANCPPERFDPSNILDALCEAASIEAKYAIVPDDTPELIFDTNSRDIQLIWGLVLFVLIMLSVYISVVARNPICGVIALLPIIVLVSRLPSYIRLSRLLKRRKLALVSMKKLNKLEIDTRKKYRSLILSIMGISGPGTSDAQFNHALSIIEPFYWSEIKKMCVKKDSACDQGKKLYYYQVNGGPASELKKKRVEHERAMQHRNHMRDVVRQVGLEIHLGERVPRHSRRNLIQVMNCPNCGGPLPKDGSRSCYYCDSTLSY